MSASRLFLSPPHQTGQELEFLRRALESNYLAPVGPDLDAFEAELAGVLGVDQTDGRRVLAVNSGAAGLHLALELAGIGRGDRVLVSDFTFIASAAPIAQLGAIPVCVDADPATWNMDPNLAEQALERLKAQGTPARAIMAVHCYGRPAPLDRFQDLARRHGIPLVEDAAESLGATWDGQATGAAGDFGVLSFNGNKLITTSGGGLLVCRRREDAAKALALATMSRDPGPFFTHSFLGYSYRLSNLLAALGRAQLAALPQRLARKQAIVQGYRDRLADLAAAGDLAFMPEPPAHRGAGNHWLACLTLAAPGETTGHGNGLAWRDRALAAMEAASIEARPLWTPLHRQPAFAAGNVPLEHDGGKTGLDLFHRGLALPSGTAMTEADLDRVTGILRRSR